MSFETIELAERDGVARITLNRPDRLNSLVPAMYQELQAALDRVKDSRCRALLLTGAGRGFCSGADLKERAKDLERGELDMGEAVDRRLNPVIRRIRALEMPVIAAVNGVAAGAGANIALACDIVLAARAARFIQAFSRIGLATDGGGSFFLPRLVGSARATALLMLAEPVTAEQAERWGMIWRCVEDDALMTEADALAQTLAKQPTRALALIKRSLDAAAANGLDAQLDLERDLQRIAGETEDFREGVRAFAEKRPARFQGK